MKTETKMSIAAIVVVAAAIAIPVFFNTSDADRCSEAERDVAKARGDYAETYFQTILGAEEGLFNGARDDEIQQYYSCFEAKLTAAQIAAINQRVVAWHKPQMERWIADANEGNLSTARRLAKIYERGSYDISQNYAEAYFWYSVANILTFGHASDDGTADVVKHLSAEQKAAVDKRVREWKPLNK